MRVFQMTALLMITLLTGIGATTKLIPINATVISKQTVTVAGITAIVRVTADNAWGNYDVYGMWSQPSASHYAIGCLDVYRSLKYELRDSGGHLMPINQKKLRQGEPLTASEHVPNTYKADCSAYPPHESVMLLTDLKDPAHRRAFPSLYPGLRPGKYALQLTFAPVAISEKALFKPVSLIIPPK